MKLILRSFFAIFLFTLLLGFGYPATVWLIGKFLFPEQAKGSLILSPQGQILGSKLLGQNFTNPRYLSGRPSANDYRALTSGSSRLAWNHEQLASKIAAADEYQLVADQLFESASGLDPHISLANARLQAEKIAAARNITTKEVLDIIDQFTITDILGRQYVTFLLVNIALDGIELNP